MRKNLGLEKPAKPTGWYRYAFRFTLQASAEVELSAERVEQGGIVGLRISGMTGDAAPTVETDLGNVQCVRAADGWRAYIPAAYNASSGGHEVNITVNGETITRSIIVLPKDFGTVDVEPEPDASDAANTQFRNAVWGLYEAPAREKMWQGGFVNPVESYTTLVDYGQVRVANGRQGSRSNSTKLYTIPGKRRGGAGRRAGPYRQHGGHRPWLWDAQLPVRAADSFRLRRAERGKGAGCGCAGRRTDHGLQAWQQEREPVDAVPDLRRAVLEGERVKIKQNFEVALLR